MKTLILIIVSCIVLLVIANVLVAFSWGTVAPFTNPPFETRYFGKGEKILSFVVLGDSITAGQGGDYETGIAISSAKYLAKTKNIALNNFSASGATVHDLWKNQLAKAVAVKPDIVLISIGANDVIHLTNVDLLTTDFTDVMKQLINSNCGVKIVITGAPDMGTVKRFLPPLSWLASIQSNRVNAVFDTVVKKYQLTNAHVFESIGPSFANDRSLFATDNFHPNNSGYAVWNSVIQASLDDALFVQPTHCVK